MKEFFMGLVNFVRGDVFALVLISIIGVGIIAIIVLLYINKVLDWNFEKLYLRFSNKVIKILEFQQALSGDSIRLCEIVINIRENKDFPTLNDKLRACEEADLLIKKHDEIKRELDEVYENIKSYGFNFGLKTFLIPWKNVHKVLSCENGDTVNKEAVQKVFDVCKKYKIGRETND